MAIDNRGSKSQRLLYEYLRKIYPVYDVHWEVLIPGTLLRYDLVVMELGLIIEFDGRQHYQFVEHFHKDVNGYVDMVKSDNFKNKWAADHGLNLIRFSDSNFPSDHHQLKAAIDSLSVDYPFYDPSCFCEPHREEESSFVIKAKARKKELLSAAYEKNKQYRNNLRKQIKENKKKEGEA